MNVNLTEPLKQAEFADLVGVSQQSVSKMFREGIIRADCSGHQWLLDYCSHIREIAAGRVNAGELDLGAERARLAKEQADSKAIDNALKRKEVAPVAMLTEIIATVGRRVAGILEAIPVELGRSGVNRESIDIVADKLALARNEIAKMKINLDQIDGSSDN